VGVFSAVWRWTLNSALQPDGTLMMFKRNAWRKLKVAHVEEDMTALPSESGVLRVPASTCQLDRVALPFMSKSDKLRAPNRIQLKGWPFEFPAGRHPKTAPPHFTPTHISQQLYLEPSSTQRLALNSPLKYPKNILYSRTHHACSLYIYSHSRRTHPLVRRLPSRIATRRREHLPSRPPFASRVCQI